MGIDIGEIILFLLIILYLFIDKYFIPNRINQKLAEFSSDLSLKLEEIKSLHTKQQFIHELQFKREFEVYSELWEKLMALKRSTQFSLPQEGILTEDYKREMRAKDKEWGDNYNAVKKIIENQRPFFAKDVYAKAKVILSESMLHSMYRFFLSDQKYDTRIFKNRVESINHIIDKIEASIHKRIVFEEGTE